MTMQGIEMDDLSTIIASVFNVEKPIDLGEILTAQNMNEAQYMRFVLCLATDVDYELGDDEVIDDMINTLPEKVSTEYLKGIMVGLLLSLEAEARTGGQLGFRPAHAEIMSLFQSAEALIYERQV
tara:strand:- start:339 stop:713 length:375 start_codon:yes stop_codon:yes gene_type:complete